MLVTKKPNPAIRMLDAWAISVLMEAGAIRACEEHGWKKDRGDPHESSHLRLQNLTVHLVSRRRQPPGRSQKRWIRSVTLARSARQSDYADFRCDLAAGFLATVSFACFLPDIGISISFWPVAALRGFFADFFEALVSVAGPPTLLRNASIRSTTFSPRGRSLGVIGLPARF